MSRPSPKRPAWPASKSPIGWGCSRRPARRRTSSRDSNPRSPARSPHRRCATSSRTSVSIRSATPRLSSASSSPKRPTASPGCTSSVGSRPSDERPAVHGGSPMSPSAPFDFVPIDSRRSTRKPRRTGLSMVIDDGLPLAYVESVLALASSYVDLMKIKTGTARLYPRAQLTAKLELYGSQGVRPFIGGQFHEYVFATQGEPALPRFYEEALELGFRTIEISDNTVPLTAEQRRRQIATAVASGLEVFGEVGSKDTLSNPKLLIDQANVCFEAGASLVLVEAAELVEQGVVRRDTLDIVRRG